MASGKAKQGEVRQGFRALDPPFCTKSSPKKWFCVLPLHVCVNKKKGRNATGSFDNQVQRDGMDGWMDDLHACQR